MAKRRKPDDRQTEMFGNVASSAIWPNHGTVARELLNSLLRGERVVQPEFKRSWRLAAAAHELQKLGWPVQSTSVFYPGIKRQIARYNLAQSAITAARLSQGGAE